MFMREGLGIGNLSSNLSGNLFGEAVMRTRSTTQQEALSQIEALNPLNRILESCIEPCGNPKEDIVQRKSLSKTHFRDGESVYESVKREIEGWVK